MGIRSLDKEAETRSSLGTRALGKKTEGMEMGAGALEITSCEKVKR